MKPVILGAAFVLLLDVTFAQTVSKVDQIVSSENSFVQLAKDKGMRKAFLEVSDENTILFRPGPVKAIDFYKDKKEQQGILWWKPMYARISKSGDWGYTSGPYTFKLSDTSSQTGYGEYFSVWKKAKNGTWKLAIDIGIPHKQPKAKPELMLDNPYNEDYVKIRKGQRIQQREDIVFSNDQLFSTILKADSKTARKEFLSDKTRLLFPGYEPILGKAEVSKFWDSQKIRLISKPIKADRAISGELAFTYGDASAEQNGQQKQYYYLRIWELQPDFKWTLLVEVLAPGA